MLIRTGPSRLKHASDHMSGLVCAAAPTVKMEAHDSSEYRGKFYMEDGL